jgi:hypothetical protein
MLVYAIGGIETYYVMLSHLNYETDFNVVAVQNMCRPSLCRSGGHETESALQCACQHIRSALFSVLGRDIAPKRHAINQHPCKANACGLLRSS